MGAGTSASRRPGSGAAVCHPEGPEDHGETHRSRWEDVGGAPVAIAGTTLLWTAAHALSHPPAFLFAVAAVGLLLALWRWACKDLVAPIIGHVIADLAL